MDTKLPLGLRVRVGTGYIVNENDEYINNFSYDTQNKTMSSGVVVPDVTDAPAVILRDFGTAIPLEFLLIEGYNDQVYSESIIALNKDVSQMTKYRELQFSSFIEDHTAVPFVLRKKSIRLTVGLSDDGERVEIFEQDDNEPIKVYRTIKNFTKEEMGTYNPDDYAFIVSRRGIGTMFSPIGQLQYEPMIVNENGNYYVYKNEYHYEADIIGVYRENGEWLKPKLVTQNGWVRDLLVNTKLISLDNTIFTVNQTTERRKL